MLTREGTLEDQIVAATHHHDGVNARKRLVSSGRLGRSYCIAISGKDAGDLQAVVAHVIKWEADAMLDAGVTSHNVFDERIDQLMAYHREKCGDRVVFYWPCLTLTWETSPAS